LLIAIGQGHVKAYLKVKRCNISKVLLLLSLSCELTQKAKLINHVLLLLTESNLYSLYCHRYSDKHRNY